MLNHKYNLGDTVYGIYQAYKQVNETCDHCGGDGKVMWSSGVGYSCYNCHGTGKKHVSSFHKWELSKTDYGTVRPKTVGLIRCEVRIENEERTIENRYMCNETGIGSGRVWDESLLWPSKIEAQAECDRRNEEASDA